MNSVTIYTDGGSRGNPGHASWAFVAYGSDQEVIHTETEYIGIATNNIAEYSAVLNAMKWLSQSENNKFSSINFFLDSELVVKQLKGLYKIKNQELLTLAQQIKAIERELSLPISFTHVRREQNAYADSLVNKTLDLRESSRSTTGLDT